MYCGKQKSEGNRVREFVDKSAVSQCPSPRLGQLFHAPSSCAHPLLALPARLNSQDMPLACTVSCQDGLRTRLEAQDCRIAQNCRAGAFPPTPGQKRSAHLCVFKPVAEGKKKRVSEHDSPLCCRAKTAGHQRKVFHGTLPQTVCPIRHQRCTSVGPQDRRIQRRAAAIAIKNSCMKRQGTMVLCMEW